jgi:hypothetical protein
MFMNLVAALLRWEAANLGWVGGGGVVGGGSRGGLKSINKDSSSPEQEV